MGVALDHLNAEQKQAYVVVGCTIGLVLSVLTYVARIITKLIFSKRLHKEDWWMAAALFFSISIAACLFFQLTVGLAHDFEHVPKPNLKKFMIALWAIQRLQQPTLFCVKTSIILFYVHVFDSPRFRIVAWIIWIYTLLWTIGVWFATLFECHPISFYWDREHQHGHCVKNPLITIGLTSGVISCLGDIMIFSMPIPVLRTLQLNPKKKVLLTAIFMLGFFVVCTSFIRWIALLGTDENITSTQVEAGVWTYLEGAIGITCANLPLMAPLLRRWLGSWNESGEGYKPGAGEDRSALSTIGGSSNKNAKKVRPRQFSIMESQTGSEIELANQGGITPVAMDGQPPSVLSDKIHVQTELALEYVHI